jgi:hypothetical protein
MADPETRIVEFERLNLLGKAVFVGGAAIRLAANFIDAALEKAADVVLEAEKAYRQGRDPNIEDAKILEERDER